MSDRIFVDTNVLVYADDISNPAKRGRARELIRQLIIDRTGVVSLQVLQEYFFAMTRKFGMASTHARWRVEIYAEFHVVRLDERDLLEAIDLHRAYQISIWDSLIVQAAMVGGCGTLYTEDMQSGFRIEELELVNPFTR